MDVSTLPFVFSKRHQVEPCVDVFEGVEFKETFGVFNTGGVYDIKVDWAECSMTEVGLFNESIGNAEYFKIVHAPRV